MAAGLPPQPRHDSANITSRFGRVSPAFKAARFRTAFVQLRPARALALVRGTGAACSCRASIPALTTPVRRAIGARQK